MSKELPGTGAPVGVFGLMGARTSRYDDNFLPSVSTPIDTEDTGLRVFLSRPRTLRRNASEPVLSRLDDASACHVPKKEERTKDDMRLAQGAVSSAPVVIDPSTDRPLCFSGDYNSQALRYDTHPQYSSSKILTSFHEEFKHFGEQTRPASNPSTLRGTSDQLCVPAQQPHIQSNINSENKSESQTLSLIKRHSIGLIRVAQQKLTRVNEDSSENTCEDSHGKELVEKDSGSLEQALSTATPSLAMPPPTDTLDGLSAGTRTKLPITKQVMGWFHGPNTKVDVTRTEMNAFAPTSF